MKIHDKAFHADYYNLDLDVCGHRPKAKRIAKRMLSKARRRWAKRMAAEDMNNANP